MLSSENFLSVVSSTPLIAIDLLIRDRCGHYLLGMRANQPAQGTWFVPGGRIRKDELVSTAISRIASRELGINIALEDCTFLGVFEHLYDSNFADAENITTHYVVLAFLHTLSEDPQILFDEQHTQICWLTKDDIISLESVHSNSKAYFQPKATSPAVAQLIVCE